MRKISTFICILLQFLSVLYTSADVASNVVVLNDKNFLTTINEPNKIILVKFFAPWCWYCNQLAPIFEQSANEVKSRSINAILAEVDCTTQLKLCRSNEIQYFPTLKIFKKGNFISEFRGRRNVENIIDFVKQNL